MFKVFINYTTIKHNLHRNKIIKSFHYLQNLNIDEDENFKIFIKETLHKFLEKKEILKDETLKQCQICKSLP